MLPTCNYYIKKHHFTILKPIIITSLILVLCFINNIEGLSFLELYFGIAAISISIIWNISEYYNSYWVYCVFSGKFKMNKINRQLLTIKENMWLCRIMSFLSSPLQSSFLICVIIFGVTFTMWPYGKDNVRLMVFCLGAVVSPLLIWCILRFTYLHHLSIASEKVKNYTRDEPNTNRKVIKLDDIIIKEIFFSVIVTLAIVLPIKHKKAFDLGQGYASPSFIVALIILIYCVLGIMLFLSRGSQINFLVGKILLSEIDFNYSFTRGSGGYSLHTTNFYLRLLVWMCIIFILVTIFCLVFELLNVPVCFAYILCTCLIPTIIIYRVERVIHWRHDFNLASDMCLRINAVNQVAKGTSAYDDTYV